MSEQLTHYKKLSNSDYLGSWDLPNGQDVVLTIKSVQNKMVHDGNGGQSMCTVIEFAENVKPMIANSTNKKRISKVLKSVYIEKWFGKPIQIGIEKVKAFGEVHDALRVRQTAPIVQQQSAPQIDPRLFDEAVINIEAASTLAELQTMYLSMDSPIRNNPKVVAAKDKRKKELEGGEA